MKKTDNTFTPAFGLKNGHLQTLYPAFFRKCKPLNMDIETFELDDGDFVQCHWVNQPEKNSNTPIVVLFHGLEGSYKSPYIQGMMHALDHSGYSCVLMHFRGCSGKINRQPRAYHSGDTADARAWIENLTKRFELNPLFGIGYSLGGNMLLKLLGEWKKDSPFKAAVSISAPMQLDISANTINKGFSKIYQRHLLEHLKFSLVQKYQYHDMKKLIGMDENDVRNIPTIWAFDDLYTAKIHGFQTAKNYYKCSSAKQYVKDIQTPTLIIHALD
ncbi:MAG: hydrolase, partial [Campylobacterota bacterium]|nr:hydrolase [Campylobacterota bacterium]